MGLRLHSLDRCLLFLFGLRLRCLDSLFHRGCRLRRRLLLRLGHRVVHGNLRLLGRVLRFALRGLPSLFGLHHRLAPCTFKRSLEGLQLTRRLRGGLFRLHRRLALRTFKRSLEGDLGVSYGRLGSALGGLLGCFNGCGDRRRFHLLSLGGCLFRRGLRCFFGRRFSCPGGDEMT